MDVYIPKVVERIQEFYGDLLDHGPEYSTIGKHLEAISRRMWEGIQQGNEFIYQEISNYHRKHLGRSYEVLSRLNLNEDDCRQTVANEFGYSKWDEVLSQVLPYDHDFEDTLNAMLKGEKERLIKNIRSKPALVNKPSRYGHGATLLHYAVANGVEIWRQQLPLNLPEIVKFLLEQGADPGSKMRVYGGEYTPPELLLSSLHPRNAGIFEELRSLMDT